jgi:hypothetical protein
MIPTMIAARIMWIHSSQDGLRILIESNHHCYSFDIIRSFIAYIASIALWLDVHRIKNEISPALTSANAF